mmetsp:Transcript_151858/g.282950  ORF Transcript_151858/g.282950 Transcript_151858/m.282950 type:complete len:365 (-) Transcript_151858:495-1589(-)
MFDGLCLTSCRCLCHDGFQWVLARRGFPTQHDSVCAIKDSICQVSNLCSCRHWILNHALNHLCCSDHEKSSLLRPLDQKLLCEWCPVHSKLDTQVTPGHHQGLRLCNDPFNVGERLWLLNLRADLRALLGWHLHAVHDVDELLQVLSLLCEGDTDVLARRVELQQVFCILNVFGCERGAINLTLGHVHTLASFQLSTSDNLHFQFLFGELLRDLNLHDAILEEQGHPRLACLDQGRLLNGGLHRDPAGSDEVAVILAKAEFEDLSVDELNVLAIDLADSELGPLQVTKHLDFLALLCCAFADERVDALEVASPSMRAVQAEDVSACVDHLGDHFLTPGCRAQAGHNLRLALAVVKLAWLVTLIH